ncbi:MAG: hypothetical protein ABIP68_03425 [Ferruginibacter sp.]
MNLKPTKPYSIKSILKLIGKSFDRLFYSSNSDFERLRDFIS